MNRYFVIFFLLMFFLGSSCSAHARKIALKELGSIAIPKGTKIKTINKAVDGGIEENFWVIEREINSSPRSVEISYSIRSHMIKIRLDYNNTQIDISYVASSNMNYEEKDNKRYIHSNYRSWSKILIDQIEDNLLQGDKYIAGKHILTRRKNTNPPQEEPFSNFSSFKLDTVTMSDLYKGNKASENAKNILENNLKKELLPILKNWSQPAKTDRTLLIRPHIESLRFLNNGTMVNPDNLNLWLYVKVQFVEEASLRKIAAPEFYQTDSPEFYQTAKTVMNYGATINRGLTLDPALGLDQGQIIETTSKKITKYVKENYKIARGGGAVPIERTLKYIHNRDNRLVEKLMTKKERSQHRKKRRKEREAEMLKDGWRKVRNF